MSRKMMRPRKSCGSSWAYRSALKGDGRMSLKSVSTASCSMAAGGRSAQDGQQALGARAARHVAIGVQARAHVTYCSKCSLRPFMAFSRTTCSQPHSEKIRFPDGGATLMVQSHGVPELVPRAYDHTRGDPRPPVADLGPPGGWLAVQGAGQAAVARPARHLAVEMRRSAPAAGWPCPGGRSTTRQTADSVC